MYVDFPCRLSAVALLSLLLSTSAQADHASDAYQAAADHFAASRWDLAEEAFTVFVERYPEHLTAANARLLLGEVKAQIKDDAAARQVFLDFLARYPGHRHASRALFGAAQAAQRTGLTDQAYQDFERFRSQFPEDQRSPHVLYALGEIAMGRRDWVKSQEFLREGLQASPHGPLSEQTRFLLGRCLEGQGDVDAARNEYRTLVENDSRLAAEAQTQLGNSYYTRGRYEEAALEFQRVLSDFSASPWAPQAHYWLGMCHVGRQRWEEAVQVLTACVRAYPEHELAPTMTFWLAEAHRRLGDFPAARPLYERTATNWPASAWADHSRAVLIQTMFTDQQYEAVVQAAEEFHREHPSSPLRPRVQQVAGRALLRLERFEEAVQVLKEIVEPPDPGDSEEPGRVPVETPETLAAAQQTLYYLAQAHLGSQQPDAALRILNGIDPQAVNPETQRGVRKARAAALIAAGQFADAIPLLEQSLADPDNHAATATCRLQLVIARARTGPLDAALTMAEQFTEAERGDALYWRAASELAEAAYEAQRMEIAERFFRQLTTDDALQAGAARGWSGLGWIHFQSADFEAAAAAFGKVQAEHAGSEQAAEAGRMRATSLFEAARLHEASAAPDAALALLADLIEAHPESDLLDAALYRRAWLLTDQQRPIEAAAAFQQISDQHPTSRYWADANYRVAELAAQQGEHARALPLLARVVDAPESSPEIVAYARYLQGQLAASAGQWDQVAPPLERLLAEAPDSPLRLPAEYWLAESYFQQQQWDLAADRFARLDAVIDAQGAPWMAMIPLRRSQILVQHEQWDEARELAETISRRFPGFRQQYEADYVIGLCLAMKARFDEARPWYERVVRSPEGGRTETAAKAQWMIGESYFHQKNYHEAIRAYRQVESLFPFPYWQAAAVLQAAKCYQQQGQRDEAARLFHRIIKDYPDSPHAGEAVGWPLTRQP
jgi:cellulose synthase operon protein C